MYYHTLFLSKIGKDVANLSSAAVVIGALRVKISVPFFVCFDSLCHSQQLFGHVGTGLTGLNQYSAADLVSFLRTQHNDSGTLICGHLHVSNQ